MGGDVFKQMCKQNSGDKEKVKARQQVTGDGFGRSREQKGEKKPPTVAKYNIHGCDLPRVEWQ